MLDPVEVDGDTTPSVTIILQEHYSDMHSSDNPEDSPTVQVYELSAPTEHKTVGERLPD